MDKKTQNRYFDYMLTYATMISELFNKCLDKWFTISNE